MIYGANAAAMSSAKSDAAWHAGAEGDVRGGEHSCCCSGARMDASPAVTKQVWDGWGMGMAGQKPSFDPSIPTTSIDMPAAAMI